MTTTADALALAYRLEAQEVLTMPGQPFTRAAVQPWLKRNDALRSEAAAALRDLAGAQARAETAEKQLADAMREAVGLARSLLRAYYDNAKDWEPLDYPAGVITQIDNMTAGIGQRLALAEARVRKLEAALDGMCRAWATLVEADPEYSLEPAYERAHAARGEGGGDG